MSDILDIDMINDPQQHDGLRKVTKVLDNGRIMTIFTELDAGYTIGDKVLINGEVPADGKILIGFWSSIKVANGLIIGL